MSTLNVNDTADRQIEYLTLVSLAQSGHVNAKVAQAEIEEKKTSYKMLHLMMQYYNHVTHGEPKPIIYNSNGWSN